MSNIQGLPPLPQCFDGLITVQRTVSETSQGELQEGVAHCLNVDVNKDTSIDTSTDTTIDANNTGDEVFEVSLNTNKIKESEETEDTPKFAETPDAKLNNALDHLKSEMSMLRKLDVSLLCQLWTLHESIQEYKNFMMDRYSDMGSEYSWGGLSSRASSITSIDSCDFGDEYMLQSDPSIINSLQGSTTSLIQQIEELKVRAETEF